MTDGLRDNKGKLPWRYLPLRALEELNRVYEFGATKYAPYNWQKGMDWSIMYDSMMRHISAWWQGEDIDAESKCHHLAHAAFGALGLIWYKQMERGKDDRPFQLEKEARAEAFQRRQLQASDRVILAAINAPFPAPPVPPIKPPEPITEEFLSTVEAKEIWWCACCGYDSPPYDPYFSPKICIDCSAKPMFKAKQIDFVFAYRNGPHPNANPLQESPVTKAKREKASD